MQHEALRRAIAQAFPDRYTDEGWQNLLLDFINLEVVVYLTDQQTYQEELPTNPLATHPRIRPELRQATTLMAQRGAISYEQLALAYYLLKIDLLSTKKHNQHLYGQYTAVADLCRQTIEGAQKAIEEFKEKQQRDQQDRLDFLAEWGVLPNGDEQAQLTAEPILDIDAIDDPQLLVPPLWMTHQLIERLRAEEAARG